MCGSGQIKFALYPDPGNPGSIQYNLEIESHREGLDRDRLMRILSILKDRGCVDAKNDIIVLGKTNGRVEIKLKKFIAMLEPIFHSGLRGKQLLNRLLSEYPNYRKYFENWYSKCPNIFDNIADIVQAIPRNKGTFIGTIQWIKIFREERPHQWLLHVGLTFIIMATSFFLAYLRK